MIILCVSVVVGIALGLYVPYGLSGDMSPYVAIAILAALDSVFGGITAYINERFNRNKFFTGFFANSVLAAGLTYVGKKIGIDLYLAIMVVFGTRMFANFAALRHFLLDYLEKRAEEKKLQKLDTTDEKEF